MAESLAAVVLAAGAGERLRPLTAVRPKPLCPVANVALVDHAIARARTVTDAVAVNVHDGRHAMEAHLAGQVHLSVEPERLGTAGALGQLRDWIDGRHVAVLNADTWCPAPLDCLLAGWDGDRVRVLVVGESSLRPTSRVAGAVMPWREVAVLDPVPTGLYEVSWRGLAAAGRIDAVRYDGVCIDCGTPERYLTANLAANGGASVIGAGAVVEGEVHESVVWAGAAVASHEVLHRAIRVGPRLTVLVR